MPWVKCPVCGVNIWRGKNDKLAVHPGCMLQYKAEICAELNERGAKGFTQADKVIGEKMKRDAEKQEKDRLNGDTGTNCFITTAVCKTLQKPDDCRELIKFRHFRDTFMQTTEEMRSEVFEYYEAAPQICASIDANGKKAAFEKYASIWEQSLKPAFAALEKGQNLDAYNIYKKMVLDLKREFLRNGEN
jgi:hypothetical protein